MKSRPKKFRVPLHLAQLIFALALALLPASAFARIAVNAAIDTSSPIYIGQPFAFQILVSGTDQKPVIDQTPLAPFNPKGPSVSTRSSTSIINGQTSTTQTYIVTYNLTVHKPGPHTIPPLDVSVKGSTYKTPAKYFTAQTPSQTKHLQLQLQLSTTQPYIGQPLRLTVNWLIRRNIAEADAVGDFTYNIPLFNSDHFTITDQTQNPDAKYNYKANNIPVQLEKNLIRKDNLEFLNVSFTKIVIPKKSGQFNFDPASVSANIATGSGRRSLFRDTRKFERFLAKAQPLTISVKPLPNQQKPDSFYGLIGRYNITAQAKPKNVYVGDPITLDVIISGNYLTPVQWPSLETIPDFTDNFKIPSQRSAPQINQGKKVYTQTIRALNDQITNIPSIPLTYFDTEKQKYITVATDPIPIKVEPTDVATIDDVLALDNSAQQKQSKIEAIKMGISANYYSPDALKNKPASITAALTATPNLIILALSIFVFSASITVKKTTASNSDQIAARKRKTAAKKALKKLKKLPSQPEQLRSELTALMRHFIGERFTKNPAAITPAEAEYIINDQTSNPSLAQSYRKILESCEAGLYAPAPVNIDKQTIETLAQIIKQINRNAGTK